jgi:hypothetical protein
VTNSVRASQRLRARADLAFVPVVRLTLLSDWVSLVIQVRDSSDELPARRDAGPDAESGRGLMLVDALGTDWGAYRTGDGKVVWVSLGPAP